MPTKNLRIAQFEEWEDTENSNCKLTEFFERDVPRFWDELSLMDTIMLACANKKGAYLAYYRNYNGFRNFCNEIWNKNVLDMGKFRYISIKQFISIQCHFDPLKIIFPPNMPYNFLPYINSGYEFTFILGYIKKTLVKTTN